MKVHSQRPHRCYHSQFVPPRFVADHDVVDNDEDDAGDEDAGVVVAPPVRYCLKILTNLKIHTKKKKKQTIK